MPDKMLIDATHPEETRVVVLRGNRVEEFDFESANRKQLRGNIYLAKVTRVEPSLQAAFVDYGGNRHGFLAFAEIHPDYYQIPVADRQALLAQEEQDARQAEAEADHRASRGSSGGGGGGGGRGRNRHRRSDRSRGPSRTEAVAESTSETTGEMSSEAIAEAALGGITPAEADRTEFPLSDTQAPADPSANTHAEQHPLPTSEEIDLPPLPMAQSESAAVYEPAEADAIETRSVAADEKAQDNADANAAENANDDHSGHDDDHDHAVSEHGMSEHGDNGHAETIHSDDGHPEDGHSDNGHAENGDADHGDDHHDDEPDPVESVGGADALEEVEDRKPRFRRNYKIQEVIKRRQVMLVQVVKEERGSKGAALTTYLSLAGRYSVLMPNTARGGGISRKITSGEDRSRLKEIAQELEVPEGMGVILRTAGASRTKVEVKRDFEYLLRLWETVRDLTLKSMAPTLVYEEGSLIKRSIRDLYSKDIDEIIVAGEAGYKEARDFMRMLMPTHAKNVKMYNEPQPLFTRYGIETQLDAMFQPTVQLRSGGYIVINQTEALVAIDVNSGRATREHHIEDTALKTNCEAADEVARQLRLRDLAGLIVIDFIDMDEGRNNRTVERRMKDALKHDRARIQVGRISHFGLLEMSRQRIRTSVLESSTEKCPVCGGLGHVRSVSSVALQLLRAIEDTLNKGGTHNLTVRTRSDVALYVLNHKRAHLRALEERFRITITISADETVSVQQTYLVERGDLIHSADQAKAIAAAAPPMPMGLEEDDYVAPEPEDEDDGEPMMAARDEEEEDDEEDGDEATEAAAPEDGEGERDGSRGRKRRRRGRGRGRGRNGGRDDAQSTPQSQPQNLSEHAAPHEDHDAASSDDDASGLQDQDGEESSVAADGVDENGEPRRRRRRGRRGGRRNRHRGNGDGAENENGNGEHAASGDDAPALNGASDAAPQADAPRHEPRYEEPPAATFTPPAPQASAPQPAAAEQPEPTRRRSTIREAAPVSLSGDAPAPSPAPVSVPAPVISSTAPEAAAEPPKRGWWAKRLLGDNS